MSFLSDTVGGVLDRLYAGAHPAITMLGTGAGLLGLLVDRPLIIVGAIGFILLGRLAVRWLEWRRHRRQQTEMMSAPYADVADALTGDAPRPGGPN